MMLFWGTFLNIYGALVLYALAATMYSYGHDSSDLNQDRLMVVIAVVSFDVWWWFG